MRGSLGHLPSCLFGGGLCPCAGYSGFDFEPGSMLLIEPKPQWAHTPTSSQPFGRVDRRAAALSAVAICDAERIGVLRVSAPKNPSAGGAVSAGECLSRDKVSRGRSDPRASNPTTQQCRAIRRLRLSLARAR